MTNPESVPPTSTPSTPPKAPVAQKSPLQSTLESLVDLAAIAVVGLLAAHDKVPGVYALIAVAMLAGVRVTDIVALSRGKIPPGGSIAGLIIALFLGSGRGGVA